MAFCNGDQRDGSDVYKEADECHRHNKNRHQLVVIGEDMDAAGLINR